MRTGTCIGTRNFNLYVQMLLFGGLAFIASTAVAISEAITADSLTAAAVLGIATANAALGPIWLAFFEFGLQLKVRAVAGCWVHTTHCTT